MWVLPKECSKCVCLCAPSDAVHIFTLEFCCFEKHVNPEIDKEYLPNSVYLSVEDHSKAIALLTYSERQFILANLRSLVA